MRLSHWFRSRGRRGLWSWSATTQRSDFAGADFHARYLYLGQTFVRQFDGPIRRNFGPYCRHGLVTRNRCIPQSKYAKITLLGRRRSHAHYLNIAYEHGRHASNMARLP
jgi:hypothetical protein